MSVHRQWAKRDLGLSLSLIARNPISTNRGFTAYKPCTNLDLHKSRQEQLRCERRRRTGNISEKYFVQQMKQNISAHRLNRSKPCPAIGPKNSRLPLDQSAVHRKLIMVWSPAFSRAFSSLPVFNLRFSWEHSFCSLSLGHSGYSCFGLLIYLFTLRAVNETNLKYLTDGLTEAVEVVVYQTYDKS